MSDGKVKVERKEGRGEKKNFHAKHGRETKEVQYQVHKVILFNVLCLTINNLFISST